MDRIVPAKRSHVKRNGYDSAGWSKINNSIPDHPKIAMVGPLAELLWIHAILYCGRYQTDGFVPASIMFRLVDWQHDFVWVEELEGVIPAGLASSEADLGMCDTQGFLRVEGSCLVDRLVGAQLVEEVEGGYLVHDYLDHQRSAVEIASGRKMMSIGGRQGGIRSGFSRRRVGEGSVNGGGKPERSLLEADTESDSDTDPDSEVLSSSVLELNLPSQAPPLPVGATGGRGKGGRALGKRRARSLPEPVGFPAFYAAFPLHVGRSKAAEAYRDRMGVGRLPGRDVLLLAVERYADYLKQPGAPKPCHPATWLNGERWTDEYPSPADAMAQWVASRTAKEAGK